MYEKYQTTNVIFVDKSLDKIRSYVHDDD